MGRTVESEINYPPKSTRNMGRGRNYMTITCYTSAYLIGGSSPKYIGIVFSYPTTSLAYLARFSSERFRSR